jgi:hypothetical protein
MSLTLAIAIIALADLALLGLLAFVMSRATLLAPHSPQVKPRGTGAWMPRTAPAPRRQTRLPHSAATSRS